LSALKDFTSGLYMSDIFRLVTVPIYLAEPCFRLALVLMSMAFVVVRIFTDKCHDVRIDDDVVRIVSVTYLDILVYYQIRLIRTPTKGFLF